MMRTLEMEAQALSVDQQVRDQRSKSDQSRKPRFEAKPDDRQRPKVFRDTQQSKTDHNRREVRETKAKVIPELVTPENCRDILSRVAEPLHDLDYDSQLELKRLKNRDAVKAIKAAIGQESDVAIAEIISSPLTSGYRSSDTFSVGSNVDGSKDTAGYFVRSGEAGAVCIPPDNLVCLRSAHKAVCDVYGAAVRQSHLPACHGYGKQEPGHWRDIKVMSNGSGEILAVVNFHPQDMGLVELQQVKNGLVDTFRSNCPLVRSLFFRPSAARHASSSEAPAELLYGNQFLEDTISDSSFKMRLGADTFPMPNPSIASKLIEAVRKELKLKGDGILLHLSCRHGGGLLPVALAGGLLPVALANQASKCFIFGDETQISEAMCNAADNGVYNCFFNDVPLNGPVLKSMLSETRADSGRISVLVTAGKSGLGFSVIRAMRIHDNVRRVVYVSSKPEGREAMANFAALSAIKGGAGKPFKLRSAIPVDYLPNTHHCEHILTWTR